MSIYLRLFIGGVLILGFLYVIHAIRKNKIDIRHALIWILVCILLAVLDIWPIILERLSRALGFELPVNMLFFLGFAIATVIIFGLTARVSKQNEQIKRLTQELALLQHEAEQLEKEKEV